MLCVISYTSFGLKLRTRLDAAAGSHEITVTNTGTVPSANVVLLFVRVRCDGDGSTALPTLVPVKSLIDFNRTESLAPGASATLSFAVMNEQLALVNATGARVLCKGDYELSYYDGVSTLRAVHSVAATEVISTIPLPKRVE